MDQIFKFLSVLIVALVLNILIYTIACHSFSLLNA